MTFRKKVLRSSFFPAALLALATATPAAAQYYDWHPHQQPMFSAGRIPPQHIDAMVRSMGYQPVAEPRPRGPLWVTHAMDRDGQHVRVLIDGFTGRVIDVLRRPLPPQRVALAPPPNSPPNANGPIADSDDEGPDYDYRETPWQRPADWPPPYPHAQPQGPNVVPFESRNDSRAPKASVTKKKEKKKKSARTAALKPVPEKEPEKEKVPVPKSRPADAPKKEDAPKSAQTPTFVPNHDQVGKTAVPPPVQPLELNKSRTNTGTPPVQPPF